MSSLSEQEQIRREKLEDLKKLGINPYPAAFIQLITIRKALNKITRRVMLL